MSEQIKVLLGVIVGSALLWFGLSAMVSESDDLTRNLTVSNTAYLDRSDKTDKTNEAEDTTLVAAANGAQEAKQDLQRQLRAEALAENEEEQDPEAEAETKEETEAETEAETESEKQTESDASNDVQFADSENAETQQADTEDTARNSTATDKNDLTSQETKRAEEETGTVRGIDLALVFDARNRCQKENQDPIYIGVLFRSTSASIKGVSFSDINKLVELFKTCGGGTLVVMANESNSTNVSESLVERRQEEVKYYLLQRRIPKKNILVSKNS